MDRPPSPGSGATAQAAPPEPLGLDLATSEPIPPEGIEAAVALMRSGALFRYAESSGQPSHVAEWETEFAAYLGRRYAVATSSCGAAMFLALHCLGVRPGDPVLMNSWTLAPVPGAVVHAGGRPVLVETTPDLTVDLGSLRARAAEHPGAVLLLSHMRGHVADLGAVREVADEFGLRLVEDCAHSLGGSWDGRPTGTFGVAGCFSTQGYKHLNSGEGGVLVTDDDEVAARAVLASGSYRLHGQHHSRPDLSVFEPLLGEEPNHSMRMSALAAAVLRPQLPLLDERVVRWRALYDAVAAGLCGVDGVRLTVRDPREHFVGSSLQFFVDDLAPEQVEELCRTAGALGVHLKWFGAPEPSGFTASYRSWLYAEPEPLPHTDRVVSRLVDVRIPLALTDEHVERLVAIVGHAMDRARRVTAPSPAPDPTSDPRRQPR
ncbi:DegT/DnrJ/EryC1/StrS family aminotransferase [Phycicoccus flavus]|uniref:Aminotransferase class I/II-fold pyridoxal phosphate-dependent enzyme n=1 Tax=Phycicoccus flavus TaxID=2502783 RepID=A0A8T6R144_9MICO|nr:aminotransferase class I/II-fold pyridoxal phosphate-dependent enzyme [Phycicoccus flavus]NHA67462.1 aminotransferase class I/II-fold pyridoxal phosphate-dependent enzyme [Phycicoccus flavus]